MWFDISRIVHSGSTTRELVASLVQLSFSILHILLYVIHWYSTSFVSVPAAILSFSTTVSTPWKRDVNFNCRFVGNPRPEFFWTFNSNRIQAGHHYVIFSNGTLHVQSVSPSDAGNYSCNVHNIHQSETLIHILRVLGEYNCNYQYK